MPTYTYQCKKCGHSHDVFHAISATPRVRCPECNATCKRLLGTGAGIIFKGSGFYETDYKKSGDRTPAKAAAPTDGKYKAGEKASSDTGTSTTKTESKAAKKD